MAGKGQSQTKSQRQAKAPSGTLEGHWNKEQERMTVKNRMEHANSKGAKDTHSKDVQQPTGEKLGVRENPTNSDR